MNSQNRPIFIRTQMPSFSLSPHARPKNQLEIPNSLNIFSVNNLQKKALDLKRQSYDTNQFSSTSLNNLVFKKEIHSDKNLINSNIKKKFKSKEKSKKIVQKLIIHNSGKNEKNHIVKNDLKIAFEQKIENYYRFHLNSFVNDLGRFNNDQNRKINDSIKIYLKNLEIGKNDEEINKSITRLIRIISTKSKYKSRTKVNLLKSPLIKNIKNKIKKKSFLNPSKPLSQVVLAVQNDDDKKKKNSKEIKEIPTPISFAMADFDYWRKKNNLPPDSKIFILIGGYPDVKKALLDRGWIENTNPNSPVFHLKWVLKVRDIDYGSLKDSQIVNHFSNTGCFTTKVGLCRNLRNLIWFDNIDIDSFYPRCFDLYDKNDFDDFVEDYKFTYAESILKEFIENSNFEFDEIKIKLSIMLIKKKLLNLKEKIWNFNSGINPNITLQEWEILLKKTINFDSELNETLNKAIFNENELKNPNMEIEIQEKLKEKILFELKNNNPQFHINGIQNIWILKPAQLSRGRGIKCFNNLEDIINNIYGKKTPFVCQKYIENPLLINHRKFDIRQWVLVTDWSPLTIWFYSESYIRFGAEDYNPKDLNNRYSHLTNNSIAKYSDNFENSQIEGNMWTMQEFTNYLEKIANKDVFNIEIKPKLKAYVINSLKSVQGMVNMRKNTFEIFGFDFMIDNNFNPWIIEINSSPAMDYSTKITERLVKMVLEDIVKVVVDYNLEKKISKKLINTGEFICISKGKKIKI